MSQLDLYLFGAFDVVQNGRLLTASDWRSQQTRTILKVLAAHYGQVVTSERLLDLLWPEDASTAARRRLHVRISQLRALLDSGSALSRIETVKGGYRLGVDNGSWLDVAAFESLAQRGAAALEARALPTAVVLYEQARALYRDDFLAEDRYESWTMARREALRERHLTVLVELAESYAQQGRFRQAIACCHHALTADPYREPIYVRLMLYQYYAGEQTQALRTYARCQDALRREVGVAPLPETETLMTQIRDGTLWATAGAPRYPPPAYSGRLFAVPYSLGNPPLVGRAREYAWLVDRWRDPAARLLLVSGEAGIGKTRLVQALLGYARSAGEDVVQTRVDPTSDRPHAALLAALGRTEQLWQRRDLTPETWAVLAPLFPRVRRQHPALPPLPDAPAAEARARLRRALLALVDGQLRPDTLLFIDDAHLLPRAAVELLRELAAHLVVVLAARGGPTPAGGGLRELLGGGHRRVDELQLEPLRETAVQYLIRQLAGRELPAVGDDVWRLTQGNPFYAVAMLQHLFETGQLLVDGAGRWQAVPETAVTLPPTLREMVAARLARLRPEQRQVFDLVAVAGGAAAFELLQHASRLSEEALLDSLDELMAAGLLLEPRRYGQPAIAITHALYREVALETLTDARRRRCARRVAAAARVCGQADGLE